MPKGPTLPPRLPLLAFFTILLISCTDSDVSHQSSQADSGEAEPIAAALEVPDDPISAVPLPLDLPLPLEQAIQPAIVPSIAEGIGICFQRMTEKRVPHSILSLIKSINHRQEYH